MLAREIKTRLETWLPANLGALAERAQSLRAVVAKTIPDARSRRRLWERLLQGPFRRAVLSGADAEAGRIFASELQGGEAPSSGRVALIGCGPGDPELITLKALQRLQEADVLVVDRLVDPKILDYARRDAERIFVGKTPGGPTTSQAEIDRILVREACRRQGRGPAQGRRSLHLRPRRRGDGGPAGRRHRRRGRARRHRRPCLRRPHRPAA